MKRTLGSLTTSHMLAYFSSNVRDYLRISTENSFYFPVLIDNVDRIQR